MNVTSGASSTDSSTTGATRRATLRPIVLGYAVNHVALAVLWALRRWHLVSPVPLWVYLVVLWGTALAGTAAEIWFRRHPSRLTLHVRVLVQAAGVTATLYVTGWGPVIAIAYAFMAQENVARSGLPPSSSRLLNGSTRASERTSARAGAGDKEVTG